MADDEKWRRKASIACKEIQASSVLDDLLFSSNASQSSWGDRRDTNLTFKNKLMKKADEISSKNRQSVFSKENGSA